MWHNDNVHEKMNNLIYRVSNQTFHLRDILVRGLFHQYEDYRKHPSPVTTLHSLEFQERCLCIRLYLRNGPLFH